MKNITEIIEQYTAGKKNLEETNEALRAAGAQFHLNPEKNVLTEEESLSGYGLLDTGTGTLDKVQVVNGELANCDCGGMRAFVLMGGKTYEVFGKKLKEVEC